MNFNSRPSARGDGVQHSARQRVRKISIHAPPRGATAGTASSSPGSKFQFTPLREGRHAVLRVVFLLFVFQFTPLREGRRASPRTGARTARYFNSRPSARGDRSAAHFGFQRRISIHAPPRGATWQTLMPLRHSGRISIHAPPRGATSKYFCPYRCRFISIHAPPRGATAATIPQGYRTTISIHAPPRGATICHQDVVAVFAISIHAPPRGATGRRRCTPQSPRYFNSRPSARGDVVVKVPICRAAEISIHAPPRWATQKGGAGRIAGPFQFTPLREGRQVWSNVSQYSWQISIHAPPRGATGASCNPCAVQDFNSRPSARGDFHPLRHHHIAVLFQFTPLREGRPGTMHVVRALRSNFNSRPSARGDGSSVLLMDSEKQFQFTPLREGRPRPRSTCR